MPDFTMGFPRSKRAILFFPDKYRKRNLYLREVVDVLQFIYEEMLKMVG